MQNSYPERHFAKFAKKIALSNNLDEIKKKIIIQREVGRVSLTNEDFTLYTGSSLCSSGRSQCVSSSELLRSEEDEKKDEEEGDNKHFTVEINFDEVWHSSLLGTGFFPAHSTVHM